MKCVRSVFVRHALSSLPFLGEGSWFLEAYPIVLCRSGGVSDPILMYAEYALSPLSHLPGPEMVSSMFTFFLSLSVMKS